MGQDAKVFQLVLPFQLELPFEEGVAEARPQHGRAIQEVSSHGGHGVHRVVASYPHATVRAQKVRRVRRQLGA